MYDDCYKYRRRVDNPTKMDLKLCLMKLKKNLYISDVQFLLNFAKFTMNFKMKT